MGFLTKIKDILFEEEEIEEPVKEKKNKQVLVKEEEPVKKEKTEEISRPIEPSHSKMPSSDDIPKRTEMPSHEEKFESERDIFKSENTFPFLDFDEDEFNQVNSHTFKEPVKPQVKSSTNVLEYERKRRIEKRNEYGKTEVKEITEKKKFKPSPIISPVYGILNEDYKIEDIKTKNEVENDFETIRKKAFEPVVEILNNTEPDETYYEEETLTVKVKEPEEEKKEKVRTIDELLESTADVKIPLDEDSQPDEVNKNEYDEIDEELDEIKPASEDKKEEFEEDDTLENDLFDLIDSMYDKREDGEEE